VNKLGPFSEADWQYTLKTVDAVMAGKRVKGWRKLRPSKLPDTAHQAKFVRLRLSVSQKDFAGMIGASLATVKAWECGARRPDGVATKILRLIAKDRRIASRLAKIPL
jgi:DNA-binding transcriptional regulator YiaG